MIDPRIQVAEQDSLKPEMPSFDIGDTVDVHCKIIEGSKQRIQKFTGTVIARKGRGTTETFTVRRLVAGEGVERIFPVHSPNVEKVDVQRGGRTRRAKLYYLRDRVGKATRLAEKKSDVPAKKKAAPKAKKSAEPTPVENAA